jgi:hypothetical protein
VATSTPDGFPVPHFFNLNDSTYLFLGTVDGKLVYYNGIDNHIDSDSSFNLVSSDFLNVNVGAYSSFWVNDIDQDGRLNMFVGQDLGGLYHLEVDPNSNASLNNINPDNEFEVYPNPFSEGISIKPKNNNAYNLTICNALGQTVYVSENQIGTAQIDLSNHEKGLYFVLISNENNVSLTKKIVKQ